MQIYLRHIIVIMSVLSFFQWGCSKVDSIHKQKPEGQGEHKSVDHDESNEESFGHNENSEHNGVSGHKSKKRLSEEDENLGHGYSKKQSKSKHSKSVTADSGVESATSFRWLKNGNKRYMKGMLRKDGQSKSDRQRLVGGQKPHAIVLSCSDSHAPPEVLFDQKLGEIFVVRTAGEALDHAAIASIEYALEHLGVHLLVVMAHESCGAVTTAFKTLNGGDAGSPSLNSLVKDIHPRIRKFLGKKPSEKYLSEAKSNASGVARDLVARSEIVSDKLKSNQLQIETAVYHLSSGWVEFYSGVSARGLASEKKSK